MQPTDLSKQKTLPKYDLPLRFVNATPGVNKVINLELKQVDNDTKMKISDDITVIFNRPKYFVGRNGSSWASE